MFARLGTRIAGAHALLVTVLAVSGSTAFLVVAERALDAEMTLRARAFAVTSAASFDVSLLPTLAEGSIVAGSLADSRLEALAAAAQANTLVVVDAEGRVLATSDDRIPRGARHPGIALHEWELERVARLGAAEVSRPYELANGVWYQSAWAPLPGSRGAAIGGDLRVGYREPLQRLRRIVTAFVVGGVLGAVVIGFLLARRVTRPLASLARAMAATGPNGLPARAGVKGKDEVGQLGERFDALVEALERHDAELRALSATVAHEVRNPLGAMSGYAELVERRFPDVETKRLVAGIRTEIDALEHLVTRFLSFAGDVRLSRSRVAIGEVLEDALRVAVPAGSGLRIERRFSPENGPVVDGDAEALREVFVNLVRNALQATGERGTLSIDAREGDGRVEVRVTDDGPGISKEILPRLFEPFATTKADGTGLGLAICRRIVAGHEGTLLFETGASGTTFRVSLPSIETS